MSDFKEPTPDMPPCCIVIGMAGSGKTTLMKVPRIAERTLV